MSRYRASFYHFLMSFVVFSGLAYLILVQWYPNFFYQIDGGWEGMRLIIAVDLVLGPLLTLVVYKAGKPGLGFDLSCIALLQISCLTAGVYIVYSERPLLLVFYEGHFYSSNADTFTRYGLEAPDPYKFGPILPVAVVSKPPANPIEGADYRRLLFQDNIPLWVYPPTYQPLTGVEIGTEVVVAGVTETSIRERDISGNLDVWLAKRGGRFDDYAFVPVHSRYRDSYLGIRRSDGRFIDVVEVPAPLGGH